jgi:hypothetical protein
MAILLCLVVAGCRFDNKPYELREGYILVQNEDRRNESTGWELVWEENFNTGSLDTTRWSRIGLFTTPKWKVPVENWREVNNCFRYITATDDRVVQFDGENIF